MSGGGGSSGPAGGFGSDSGTSCDQLRFEAFLSGVQDSVLASLTVGNVLSVGLQQTPVRAIVVREAGGQVVGALTTRVRELLRCLQQQVDFEAEVLAINGGDVRVAVRPR